MRPGDTFVDLGANIGAYSLWAAKLVGPRGTVVAVEAEPRNFAVFCRNVQLNGFSNIRTFNIGVSDRYEQLTLFLNETRNSGGHTFVGGLHSGSSSVQVKCKPLAEILREAEVRRVDFMKLDIEGFEERVLSKFFEDVPRDSALRPTHIVTEVLFGRGSGSHELVRIICEAGYVLAMEKKGSALLQRRNESFSR